MDANQIETVVVSDAKKLDYKVVLIIVLAIGMFLSFFIGHKVGIDYHKDDIKALHAQNDSLSKDVTRIVQINEVLTVKIDSVASQISINNDKITNTQSQLEVLNNKKNEIHNTVNHMSSNDVSSIFSTYLEKGQSSNHY